MHSLQQQVINALANGEKVYAKNRKYYGDWFRVSAMEWRNGNEMWARAADKPIQDGDPQYGEWFRCYDVEID